MRVEQQNQILEALQQAAGKDVKCLRDCGRKG